MAELFASRRAKDDRSVCVRFWPAIAPNALVTDDVDQAPLARRDRSVGAFPIAHFPQLRRLQEPVADRRARHLLDAAASLNETTSGPAQGRFRKNNVLS
jgi:hypothetical protein